MSFLAPNVSMNFIQTGIVLIYRESVDTSACMNVHQFFNIYNIFRRRFAHFITFRI